MTLFSTKYTNNFRTITGLNNGLYKDDVSVLCNTSGGPVSINLDEIPADKWNTTLKIFISDSGNNAAVNNITINAPSGYTINNATSITIAVNGGGCVLRILNNTSYQASLNYCCGGGNVGFVSILNAALLSLMSAGTVAVGTFYLVTDVSNSNGGVIVLGTTTKTVELQGDGLFLNPDYRNVSGVNKGVWKSTLAGLTANVSIVIWNGLHYKNLTGSVGTAPSGDATNWAVMTKSIANGYIPVCDFVKYNPASNLVIYRADNLDNEVEYYNDGKGSEAIALFQWGNYGTGQGDGQVYGNKVNSSSILDCLNNYKYVIGNRVSQGSYLTSNTNAGVIQYNEVIGASFLKAADNAASGNIVENIISCDSTLNLNSSNSGSWNRNIVTGASVVTAATNTKNFLENTFGSACIVNLSGNTGDIKFCTMNANLTFDLTTNTSDITSKICQNGMSTFEANLNLDDTSIFNVVTQVLTIATSFQYVGLFFVYSAVPQVIRYIANLPSNGVVSFQSAPGYSEQFEHSAIGVATANAIVCDAGASTNEVVGRTNGSDFIRYQLRGNLNVRENLTILQ